MDSRTHKSAAVRHSLSQPGCREAIRRLDGAGIAHATLETALLSCFKQSKKIIL